jgi:hypothetical protein
MEQQDSGSSRPGQLNEVAGLLRRGARPRAGALERVKSRVDARVERRRFTRFRRIAIATVALGILFSGGGASVAITALSGPTGDAAQAVYPEGDVQGETRRQDGAPDEVDDGDVLGGQPGGGANLQPAGQVAAAGESSQLPFTGLAAIPLLLLGAAMLLVGATMLRRLQRPRNI